MARGAVIAAVLALAIGVGGLVVFRKFVMGDVQSVAASLSDEIEAAKKEGVPLEIDDLKLPVVSDADNAAIDYQKAFDLYQEMPRTDRTKLLDEMNGAIRSRHGGTTQIDRFAPIRAHLLNGAKKKQVDFRHDWKQGYLVEFPEFAQMKAFVKLLGAQAILDARAGRTAEALASLKAGQQLSIHSGAQPLLIAMLVRLANEAIVVRSMEIIASERASDSRMLAGLASLIAGFEPRPEYMFYVGGEVVGGRYGVQMMKSEGELEALAAGLPVPTNAQPLDPTMRKAYEARFLSHWRKLFKLMNASQKKDALTLGGIIDTATLEEEPKWKNDPTARYVRVALPVFAQTGNAMNMTLTKMRLLDAKLAILQYRKAHGRYPNSLAQLKKKLIDPFTNQPLVYKKTPVGFMVYGVASDLKDDGGLDMSGSARPDIAMEHPLNLAKLPRDLSGVR